mgnify:CR=1 FL=1
MPAKRWRWSASMRPIKRGSGRTPRRKRRPGPGLLAGGRRASSPPMSERIAPEPIRPPAESRRRAALRFGVIGLGLGLIGSAIFIIPGQRPANAVTKVFAEARAVLLTARVERGVWPPDGELPAMLGEGRAPRLRALLAECPLAGTWRFVGVKTGGPAIIFTPGLRALSTSPTPVMVPPVPIPATTKSTWPSVSRQISSAVVLR